MTLKEPVSSSQVAVIIHFFELCKFYPIRLMAIASPIDAHLPTQLSTAFVDKPRKAPDGGACVNFNTVFSVRSMRTETRLGQRHQLELRAFQAGHIVSARRSLADDALEEPVTAW